MFKKRFSVRKMRVLRFTSFEDTFDATLLVVALSGVFLYNTFSAVSAVRSIPRYGSIGIISVVMAVVRFLEGGLQTVFILEGLRRSARHAGHVHQKPGRAVITFLLLCNLSLWVVNTFEVGATFITMYLILEWTKTSLDTSPGSLFGSMGVHVTSDVVTHHCSACRRRGTIERRLTLLRNT